MCCHSAGHNLLPRAWSGVWSHTHGTWPHTRAPHPSRLCPATSHTCCIDCRSAALTRLFAPLGSCDSARSTRQPLARLLRVRAALAPGPGHRRRPHQPPRARRGSVSASGAAAALQAATDRSPLFAPSPTNVRAATLTCSPANRRPSCARSTKKR